MPLFYSRVNDIYHGWLSFDCLRTKLKTVEQYLTRLDCTLVFLPTSDEWYHLCLHILATARNGFHRIQRKGDTRKHRIKGALARYYIFFNSSFLLPVLEIIAHIFSWRD